MTYSRLEKNISKLDLGSEAIIQNISKRKKEENNEGKIKNTYTTSELDEHLSYHKTG